ncbi:MAG: spermidine synthase [Parasphingorhabdus sp.]|jgi:spermidine synthase
MAVIYSQIHNQRKYEVRTAGTSIRLYTNGVFHSQYNPRQRASGSIWDLLSLPALLTPTGRIQRVLLLGVGGGAIVRMLESHLCNAQFVGIEMDEIHIMLARRYFGVSDSHCEMIHSNAVDWVSHYAGERFDLIIDDLFSDEHGVACRAVDANSKWLIKLTKLLLPGGQLVCNFASTKEFRASAFASMQNSRKGITQGYSLGHETLENIVGVLSRGSPNATISLKDIESVFGKVRCRPISLKKIRPRK